MPLVWLRSTLRVCRGAMTMPRLLMLTKPSHLISRAYVPDHPVGVGGPNLRKDVLLVQFLLAAIQRKPEVSAGVTRDYSKDSSGKPIIISIDGLCGPHTITAIRRYQELYDSGVD